MVFKNELSASLYSDTCDPLLNQASGCSGCSYVEVNTRISRELRILGILGCHLKLTVLGQFLGPEDTHCP